MKQRRRRWITSWCHGSEKVVKQQRKWQENGGKMVGSSKENGGLICFKQRTWELKYQNMGKLSVLQQPWIALMVCFFPTAG